MHHVGVIAKKAACGGGAGGDDDARWGRQYPFGPNGQGGEKHCNNYFSNNILVIFLQAPIYTLKVNEVSRYLIIVSSYYFVYSVS